MQQSTTTSSRRPCGLCRSYCVSWTIASGRVSGWIRCSKSKRLRLVLRLTGRSRWVWKPYSANSGKKLRDTTNFRVAPPSNVDRAHLARHVLDIFDSLITQPSLSAVSWRVDSNEGEDAEMY